MGKDRGRIVPEQTARLDKITRANGLYESPVVHVPVSAERAAFLQMRSDAVSAFLTDPGALVFVYFLTSIDDGAIWRLIGGGTFSGSPGRVLQFDVSVAVTLAEIQAKHGPLPDGATVTAKAVVALINCQSGEFGLDLQAW